MMLLFLNDIAGSEVLVILVFILIFFGSKSIPGIAQTMGRTIRQIKDASNELQSEIKKSGADIKKDLNLTGLIQETATEIQRPLDQYASDLDDAVKYTAPRNTQILESTDPSELPSEEPTAEEPLNDSVEAFTATKTTETNEVKG
jgi:sec-independent protein translocase protein TatA